MARKIEIALSEISGLIDREMVEVADALEPGDHGVLVWQMPSGRYEILDGYHRTAGYMAGRSDLDAKVTVVLVDDPDLAARASEPGEAQAEAIEKIMASL